MLEKGLKGVAHHFWGPYVGEPQNIASKVISYSSLTALVLATLATIPFTVLILTGKCPTAAMGWACIGLGSAIGGLTLFAGQLKTHKIRAFIGLIVSVCAIGVGIMLCFKTTPRLLGKACLFMWVTIPCVTFPLLVGNDRNYGKSLAEVIKSRCITS